MGIVVLTFPIADFVRMEYYKKKLTKAYREGIHFQGQAGAGSAEDMDALGDIIMRAAQSAAQSNSGDQTDRTTLPDAIIENSFTASRGVTGTIIPYHISPGTEIPGLPSQAEETEEPAAPVSVYTEDLNVIGVLNIPKINVTLPILDRVTNYTLNNGVAHIGGTTTIGTIGNCGIAGHRGLSRSYFLTRANELEKGDFIYIESNGKTYEYIVYQKKIVPPSDTSVLNRSTKDKVLTLVTCDPPGSGVNRLIIHALQKP